MTEFNIIEDFPKTAEGESGIGFPFWRCDVYG